MYEKLMYRVESDWLDFKSEQYKFDGEKDKNIKSELLKDILAFANSWNGSESFILIGVKENNPPPHDVTGITKHIDDARIQQFVNSKTNTPISFSYSTETCHGMSIGVIKINHTKRPVYLKQSYGKLIANKVYIRRGSSTDIAGVSEIADMGATSVKQSNEPQFSVEFFDETSGESIGSDIEKKLMYDSTLPPYHSIPNFYGTKEDKERDRNIDFMNPMLHETPKINYLRDTIEFVVFARATVRTELCITNLSTTLAKNVIAQIEINNNDCIEVLTMDCAPSKPKAYENINFNMPEIKSIHDVSRVEVHKYSRKHIINISFGDIQPKQSINIGEHLFFHLKKPLVSKFKYELNAKISGDNVSNPVMHKLTFKIEVIDESCGWKNFIDSNC